MAVNNEASLIENPIKKERNTGLDLLRCIAMLMIVVLHYLGKGDLLPDMSLSASWNACGITAWFLEAVCIVAVNIYMLISGYFLCVSHFKLSRLIGLYIQLWFYSVSVGLIAMAFGLVPAQDINLYNVFTLIFPVSMGHYWFMTAYVYFYLFLPLLVAAVNRISKKQLGITVILLLIVHTGIKSVLPIALEMDQKGYDFLWYTVLFLVAAYIRKYEPGFLSKKVSAILLSAGVIGAFAEVLVLGKIGEATGSLEYIRTISMNYNHIFPLCGSVGFFGLFKDIKIKGAFAGVVSFVSPLTLGVYLLHENIGVRYAWQKWFGCGNINNVPELIGFTCLAMLAVFAAGILVEFIRKMLFSGIDKGLGHIKPYRKLREKIALVDKEFANK